jgi:hypothetical protein
VRRPYSPEEIDAFAAYCADVDRCYFLPFRLFERHMQIRIRLGPSRNNQRIGVNWAVDFELEARLLGAWGL